jgi:hypothetical protein
MEAAAEASDQTISEWVRRASHMTLQSKQLVEQIQETGRICSRASERWTTQVKCDPKIKLGHYPTDALAPLRKGSSRGERH